MKNIKLFLFVLVALIPVILLRDYTPDNELRYLSIADEALRNHTLFSFTNQGMPYADKPPLYLWFVMLNKWLFGHYSMWFLSLFSIIPAFVIVRTMDKWVSAELSESSRLTGNLLMLSCGLFTGMLVTLRMDMLMCMFITLSLYTFYRMVKGEGNYRKQSILFPVYIFLAIFSKGPVGILVPLLGTIVFLLITKRIHSIGRYWGWKTWLILLIGCVLWFGAVYLEGGYAYLDNLLFHQTIDRAVNSFHHEEPFYYYCIAIWYSLAPWSILLIGTILVTLCRRKTDSELQKFFFTIAIVTFVMLSLISSKIQVYLLPAFPFFVYGALLSLRDFKWNLWTALCIALPAVIFVGALTAFIVLTRQEDLNYLATPLFYTAAAILSISGIVTLYLLYARHQIAYAIRVMACGLFIAVFAGGWDLPRINSEIGYGELCAKSKELAEKYGLNNYYVWKVRRPESMDVYLQKKIELTEPEQLAETGKDAIFMLPAKKVKELPDYFAGKETYQIGRYAIMVIR